MSTMHCKTKLYFHPSWKEEFPSDSRRDLSFKKFQYLLRGSCQQLKHETRLFLTANDIENPASQEPNSEHSLSKNMFLKYVDFYT